MEEFYYEIKNADYSYQKIEAALQLIREKNQNAKVSDHFRQIFPLQQRLTKTGMDLIWKRIDFLPEFMVLLDTLREIENFLKNIILKYEGKSISLTNYSDRKPIYEIFEKSKNLLEKAKCLSINHDYDFLRQIYRAGLSAQAIEILKLNNIRKSNVTYLTDADISQLGIKLIGDKLILKGMMGREAS